MIHLKTPRMAAIAAMSLASGYTVDLSAGPATRRHAAKSGTDDSSNLKALSIDDGTGGASGTISEGTAQQQAQNAGSEGTAQQQAEIARSDGTSQQQTG